MNRKPEHVRAGLRRALILVLPDAMLFTHRARILDFAFRNRLPSVYWRKEFAEAGGLISYGVDNPAMYRRAATHVGKILKGANLVSFRSSNPASWMCS